MRHVNRIIVRVIPLLFLILTCAHGATTRQSEVFVGTTPAARWVRDFVTGLAPDAPCHAIAWELALTNQGAAGPGTFTLTAVYQIPKVSNPNQLETGPRVSLQGTWELLKGIRAQPDAVLYRLTLEEPRRALSFVRVSDGLLHLLNADQSLAIGNGGQSYTLNRADQAEKPGDSAAAMNAPSVSYKMSPIATGAAVFGIFEGRTPCHGISRELKLSQHAGCIKAKWRLTLYQDPVTAAPTTYKVEGSLFREKPREGTWRLLPSPSGRFGKTLYELSAAKKQPALALMKGDDYVLFFVNEKCEPMVGHADFSYTLNRVPPK
jgi:hypothetical protein